jgi:hypothetical protein
VIVAIVVMFNILKLIMKVPNYPTMNTNNKTTNLNLIVSQVYNDIIHNSLKSNLKNNNFDHFVSFFS